MKKYVTVAIILIIVVAAHIFFLKPLFSSKPEKVKLVSENIIDNVPAEQALPPRSTFKKTSPNPLFGKFFDYHKAVWDNKLPIAACKQVRAGILADLDNHKVLWAKNPRTGVPIASMTKMMTLLLAFEAMDERVDLDLNTPVKVTRLAAGLGGSQVYLDTRETHPFGELLKAMAIKSANDCACLVGEFIGGGDVYTFVNEMNKRAYKLRMPSTTYINPHGLTINRKYSISSPEGQLILAENLLQYPLLMQWFSTRTAYFREKGCKHRQFLTNTNHWLLKNCPGVDGMKTGYTKAAGSCITVTCIRNGKRLIAVVTGFKSSKARGAFVKKLFDWGYNKLSMKK